MMDQKAARPEENSLLTNFKNQFELEKQEKVFAGFLQIGFKQNFD
jgi:methionine-rich copper-binding protein CopC